MVHPSDPDYEWREGGSKREAQRKKDAKKAKKERAAADAAAILDASRNIFSRTNEEGDVIVPDLNSEDCGTGCSPLKRSDNFTHGNGSCGCFG